MQRARHVCAPGAVIGSEPSRPIDPLSGSLACQRGLLRKPNVDGIDIIAGHPRCCEKNGLTDVILPERAACLEGRLMLAPAQRGSVPILSMQVSRGFVPVRVK
jgi:hypothetical protein